MPTARNTHPSLSAGTSNGGRELNDEEVRVALESAPDAVVIVDHAGRIIFANLRCFEMFACDNDDLAGQAIEILLPERFRVGHVKHRQRFVANPSVRDMGPGLDVFGCRKDGSEFAAEISLGPINVASETLVACTIRDVTQRRRAEQRFRGLLESAPDAMVIVATNGGILFVNRQTERMFGYPRKELFGRSVETLIPEGYSTQQHSAPIELVGRHEDGSEFPVEISISPIQDQSETIYASVIRDISERKESEQLLKERQDDLAHVSRLATMGEMATGLAHELNQPLYTIANYTDGCLRRLANGPMDQEELCEILRQMNSEAQRGGEIIRRLRRMVQKRMPENLAVDLRDIVRETTGLLANELRENSVSLECNTGDEPQIVIADEIQIQQVLLNLMRNAVEAMQDTAADQRRLSVAAERQPDQMICVSVQDSGCGIPVDQLDRVFDAFHTTRQQGMGMGLAISRSIIESHDGRIWVENNDCGGATFVFVLPNQE